MTFMNAGQNRELGNSSFGIKRPVYALSNLQITKKIAEENTLWNADRIAMRQRWLASQATSIWRISQL